MRPDRKFTVKNTLLFILLNKPKHFNAPTKLCLKEVNKMGGPPEEVTVVPNTIWSEATAATIKIGEEIITKDVPIERLNYTDATLKVWKEADPNGMVYLNELDPPENENPITLPLKTSTGENIENVVVYRGGEWPTGIVALFWPE